MPLRDVHEAATVLTDANFSTVVAAIHTGRRIHDKRLHLLLDTAASPAGDLVMPLPYPVIVRGADELWALRTAALRGGRNGAPPYDTKHR